jgi:hypothetical protein
MIQPFVIHKILPMEGTTISQTTRHASHVKGGRRTNEGMNGKGKADHEERLLPVLFLAFLAFPAAACLLMSPPATVVVAAVAVAPDFATPVFAFFVPSDPAGEAGDESRKSSAATRFPFRLDVVGF